MISTSPNIYISDYFSGTFTAFKFRVSLGALGEKKDRCWNSKVDLCLIVCVPGEIWGKGINSKKTYWCFHGVPLPLVLGFPNKPHSQKHLQSSWWEKDRRTHLNTFSFLQSHSYLPSANTLLWPVSKPRVWEPMAAHAQSPLLLWCVWEILRERTITINLLWYIHWKSPKNLSSVWLLLIMTALLWSVC